MASIHGQNEARRRQIQHLDDISVKDQTVSGRTQIVDVGEVEVVIPFPVVFTGKPVFTYGSDFDTNSAQLEAGSPPPHATATVIAWETFGSMMGAFEGYHTGCTVSVETKGTKGQRLTLTWSFHGPALRNPVKSDEVIVIL